MAEPTLIEPAPGPPSVFISYARADRSFVDRLVDDLQARRVTLWIDRQELRPGTADWEHAIREAIRAAQTVLLVASEELRRSPYVRDELDIAKRYRRPVLPVWAAGDEWIDSVPLGLGRTQFIDARGDHYDTALAQLLGALNAAGLVAVVAVDTPETGPSFVPRNPYKGLRPFTAADTADFFGRSAVLDQLVAQLGASLAGEGAGAARLLVVAGPSGSGKSSVVRAGLLPRLQGAARGLPGSADWIYLDPFLPGPRPMEALANTFARVLDRSVRTIQEDLEGDSVRGLHLLTGRLASAAHQHVVVTIDQFEELFTQTDDEVERQRVLDLIVAAVTERRGPTVTILTMRADFYDRLMAYPDAWPLVAEHTTFITPLSVEELREVIEGPARLPEVRMRFEGDLIGDLLFEMRGQAGALPLLEFTLDQLFEQRRDHLFTEAAYRELGGVHGALRRHAEATYAGLASAEHRELARALFLRLIDPGGSDQEVTRRRTTLTEFALADELQTARMRETIEAFIGARLLVTSLGVAATTVEVGHEALIREWPRLAGWVLDARQDVRLQQTISGDAEEWEHRGHPVDYLYRGMALDEAEAWAERNTPSALESAFLAAGGAQRLADAETERVHKARELELTQKALQANRRAASRLRYLAGALLVFLVGMAALAALALGNAATATTNARRATAAQATAVAERDAANAQRIVALSRQLAAESISHEGDQIDLALLLAVEANHQSPTLEARGSLVSGLVAATGLVAWLRGHTAGVQSVAFSPDGKILASASLDHTIRLWDVASRRQLGAPLTGHTDWVWSVAFSPDGRILASGSADDTVRLWDVASGQPLGPPLAGHTGAVSSVAFSPNGRVLASGSYDGTIRLWDVAGRRQIGAPFTGTSGSVQSIAFSPDGRTLAAGNSDGTIRLWDVSSGQAIGSPITGHTGAVESVAFSPDGKTLASGSRDETVRLWDVDPSSWVQRACGIANRNLTLQEWQRYLGDEPYHTTCPGLPSPGAA